jgi:N-acetylmuramoyl-L-alanine amidase
LIFQGCAPKFRIERFYQSLKEPLDKYDLSALRGKRIVIDPGHGGKFSGAIGEMG